MQKIKVRSLSFDSEIPDKKKSLENLKTCMHFNDMPFADNLVWDDDEPDYLFVFAYVYNNPKLFKIFRRLSRRKEMIRIFCWGECLYPDLNIFDYAVQFCRKFRDRDRISTLPTRMAWFEHDDFENNITHAQALEILKSKHRFCNFLYSNAFPFPYRDNLFYALSGYKKIDSLGKHLNNVGTLISGETDGTFTSMMRLAAVIKSRYKFTITAENARFEGYNSEKLFTSFMAHSVPIYWGNPYVAEEYNPEAFVNCNDYDTVDAVVERVKEIDADDDLWAHIVSQPLQTQAQKETSLTEYEHYKEFMINIFSQPLRKAKRIPEGTWPNIYERRIMNPDEFSMTSTIIRRIKKVIRDPRQIFMQIKQKTLPETDIDDFFNDQGEKI